MKTINMNSRRQAGFTLIEIAIVLVIIGLLLGGVLQGQQLIENSKVRSARNTFDGIATAFLTYRDNYGRLPGDDGDLSSLQARGGNWSSITLAGDTDGFIEVSAAETFTGGGEEAAFFQHLRAAALITGSTSDEGALALPQSPFGGLVGLTSDPMGGDGAVGSIPDLDGTKVCMAGVPGSAARALDTQMDDRQGTTGRFRATVGGANEDPANGSPTYSDDESYTICYRI